MEAKRNLENFYKRRLDEMNAQRFQSNLHLQILKQYLVVCHSTQPDNTLDTSWLDDLFTQIKRHLAERNMRTLCDTEQLWTDSLYIAQSQLDKLPFAPKTFPMPEIVAVVAAELAVPENDLDWKSIESLSLSLDMAQLGKVCYGLYSIFRKYNLKIVVRLIYDQDAHELKTFLENPYHSMFLVRKGYDTANSIFNRTASTDTPIDDEVVLFFICKSLVESMGGTFLFDNNVIEFDLPAEIVDGSLTAGNGKQVKEPSPPSPPSPPAPPSSPFPPAPSTPSPPSPPMPPSSETPAPTKSLAGKTLDILMVEDDPISRSMFKRYWNKQGQNVFTAKDGMEGIESFKKQRFSIVFLDVEMPFKNGIDTARDMREYEAAHHLTPTPIIGVSGYTEKKYREQALNSGMNDFISKGEGYQWKDIYNMVVKYCGI